MPPLAQHHQGRYTSFNTSPPARSFTSHINPHQRLYGNLPSTLTTRSFNPHTHLYPHQRQHSNLPSMLTIRSKQSDILRHYPVEIYNRRPLLPLDMQKLDLNNVLCEQKLPLLVDLDHTLVHSIVNTPVNMAGVEIFTCETETDKFTISMRYRPGAKEFLHKLSAKFELIVCTKGTLCYAKQVVEHLDPAGTLFKSRIIANEHFVSSNSKEEILSNILECGDKSHILVIDDSPEMWSSTNTLIPVKEYYFDGFKHPGIVDEDCHLLDLEETLSKIHNDFFTKEHKSLSGIVNDQVEHMQHMDVLVEAFRCLKIE